MNDELDPELLDQLEEDAYIAACELVGPNDPEFSKIREGIFDRLVDRLMPTYTEQSGYIRMTVVLNDNTALTLEHDQAYIGDDRHPRPISSLPQHMLDELLERQLIACT
jgi:hypothetical protein